MITKTNTYDDKYIYEQLKLFKLVDMRERYQEIIDEAFEETEDENNEEDDNAEEKF